MSRAFFLFHVLFCAYFSASGFTDNDSIVAITDLRFQIDEEENNFKFKNNAELLDLLFYTDNQNPDLAKYERFKSNLTQITNELKPLIAKSKKPEKKVKSIYKAVHDKFFTKYELKADFHQIVDDGTYNCVTATLLYSIVLEELGIPYTIKETPRHVYIISYPQTSQILIESTDPSKGYLYFNDDYKNMFVNNLKENKIISEKEYKSQSINVLFEKYYYTDKDINLQQLVGIHYSNNATSYFENEDKRAFQDQIMKASYLYPCPRNSFLLLTATLLLLDKAKYDDPQQVEDLIFLARFIDKGVSSEDIVNEFGRITYEYLVSSSRLKELDSIYQKFRAIEMPDDAKDEMAFLYNYEKGRYYLQKGRYYNAYPFVLKAFELKPGHADAQTNLIANVANFLILNRDIENNLLKTDTLVHNYPILLENNNFVRVYGLFYLACIENDFKNNRPAEGAQRLTVFEEIYKNNPSVRIEEDMIGRTYSEAAVYYFKKGQTRKCREFLNRGLEIAPNSRELKSRLQMLNY